MQITKNDERGWSCTVPTFSKEKSWTSRQAKCQKEDCAIVEVEGRKERVTVPVDRSMKCERPSWESYN